jgi:hypothetical protein
VIRCVSDAQKQIAPLLTVIMVIGRGAHFNELSLKSAKKVPRLAKGVASVMAATQF